MKTILVLVGLIAGQASAADIVASMTRQPGFERNPVRTTLQIEADGKVMVYTHAYRTGEDTTTELATINLEKIEGLQTLVDSIEKVELTDLQEGKPRCTDAPSYSYEIHPTEADKFSIARRASCHEFVLKGEDEYSARQIKDLLQALYNLSYL